MVSAELETTNKPLNSTGSNISIIIETNDVTSSFLASKVAETSEIVSKSNIFDGRWSWVVLLVSLYGTTVVGFSYSLFALLYKDFILEFEVTTSTAGWIGSMHVGCGNIGVIFLGVAIERFGCRLVCLAGTMIASLGYFLSYYARHILSIYFSYGFLAGIGMGMISMASVIATQQCFDKRRAFAGAVVTVGYSLGSITSGLVIRFLYEKISWQSVCILFACIILQMAVLATLALAPSSLPGAHKRSEGQTRRNKISEYTKLLCEPAILTFLLANFFVHIGLNTFYQHTPNRAMSLGVQPSEIAIWPMTSAIATMVAKLTGGLVANMPCVNRLLFYSAMIFLSGLTQTVISLCNDFPSIIAQGIVQSSFNGAFICLLTTICVDLKGINEIAKSQSLLALFVGSGVLISTPFAGFLYDATKNYDLTFIVTGVITLSGTFFSLLSNYYQRKKSRQSPGIL